MNKHTKKMIAPIIITILIIAYYIGIGALLCMMPFTAPTLFFLLLIPALLAGIMIYVCKQRISEIKEGEEDDLSQY